MFAERSEIFMKMNSDEPWSVIAYVYMRYVKSDFRLMNVVATRKSHIANITLHTYVVHTITILLNCLTSRMENSYLIYIYFAFRENFWSKIYETWKNKSRQSFRLTNIEGSAWHENFIAFNY